MDDEEYFKRVVKTFQNYKSDLLNQQSYAQKLFSDASLSHKEALLKAGFGQYLENLMNCVEANNSVLEEILTSAVDPTSINLKSANARYTL